MRRAARPPSYALAFRCREGRLPFDTPSHRSRLLESDWSRRAPRSLCWLPLAPTTQAFNPATSDRMKGVLITSKSTSTNTRSRGHRECRARASPASDWSTAVGLVDGKNPRVSAHVSTSHLMGRGWGSTGRRRAASLNSLSSTKCDTVNPGRSCGPARKQPGLVAARGSPNDAMQAFAVDPELRRSRRGPVSRASFHAFYEQSANLWRLCGTRAL